MDDRTAALPLVVPCAPGQFHLADTREIRAIPGEVGRHRRQPTRGASVEAGLRFLNATCPGWEELAYKESPWFQPWDQVSVTGHRFAGFHRSGGGPWTPPPPPQESRWRRFLKAIKRHLPRRRSSRFVSAFDAGWVAEDSFEETWW